MLTGTFRIWRPAENGTLSAGHPVGIAGDDRRAYLACALLTWAVRRVWNARRDDLSRLARVKQDVAGERITGRGRFQPGQRLRSPRDFEHVRRRGRHVGGALLSLSFARRDEEPGMPPPLTRIGFSVSKRVGGAVQRNRVKRRLRESVRKRYAALAPGWDVIVTARSGAAQAEYAALDTALVELLARARVVVIETSGPAELADTPERSETSATS